ncbi:MAG: transcriptional repressor LexA [Anaerolineae bacterium]|nr:transcriptional repressor LexA [Anaerolineae bacterium]MDW8102456.1 transcriptional repressor LexA [Anaerolineae bacterium]
MTLKGKTLEIFNFIQSSPHPPTIREIQKELKIKSTSTVHYHLSILEKSGLIERQKGKARGVILKRDKTTSVPILGFIYADRPLPGPESPPEEFLPIPSSFLKNARSPFALRVVGDSMMDAGIHDGDVVILDRVYEVRNGDMVAAWLRGRNFTTLKRFFRDEMGVTLKPESPFFREPIRIEGEELENLEIQGKVLLVIRDMSYEGKP